MSTRICDDPTRADMLSFLGSITDETLDDVDIECAIWWFCADNHGGQWSNLYAALCASPYQPGPCERGPEGLSAWLYEELTLEFTTKVTA